MIFVFLPALVGGLIATSSGVVLYRNADVAADRNRSNLGQTFGSSRVNTRVQRSSTPTTMRWVAVGWCAIGLLLVLGSFFDIGWGQR